MKSLYGQGFCLLKEKNTQLCAALRLQCQSGFNVMGGIRQNLCCGLDRAIPFSGEEISALMLSKNQHPNTNK